MGLVGCLCGACTRKWVGEFLDRYRHGLAGGVQATTGMTGLLDVKAMFATTLEAQAADQEAERTGLKAKDAIASR